jgi:hypothetical protein
MDEIRCATVPRRGGDQMKEGQIIGRRQKLRRIEVLRAADKEARTLRWFEGRVPTSDPNREDRGQATKDLVDIGLLEKNEGYPGPGHPHPYRLTPQGKAFMEAVMARIGGGNSVDWKRVKEIEFSTSQGRSGVEVRINDALVCDKVVTATKHANPSGWLLQRSGPARNPKVPASTSVRLAPFGCPRRLREEVVTLLQRLY